MTPEQLRAMGARFADARRHRGYSVEEAAGAVVMHTELLRGIEQGRSEADLEEAYKLARLYAVSLDWLAGLSDEGGPR